MSGSNTSLAECRVLILGLGLMGGSLGLALQGRCAARLGYDPHPQATALALERGVVDQAASDLSADLPPADLIVLAAPVRAILDWIERLPGLHPGPAVVIDLGSTKRQVCAALDRLPERFEPLGGHPMCGKECGGVENAEAGLYQQAPFALVRLERASLCAAALAEQLVRAVGARPLWLEAETHDRWVAAVSHLPYLLSNALAVATPPEALPLAGPGLRSATRLAGSSLTMMSDILATNGDNVLAALAVLRARLDALERALGAGDEAGLVEYLAMGKEAYHAIHR